MKLDLIFNPSLFLSPQEAAIGVFSVIKRYLDDQTMRKLVLPKAKGLFQKSTNVRVSECGLCKDFERRIYEERTESSTLKGLGRMYQIALFGDQHSEKRTTALANNFTTRETSAFCMDRHTYMVMSTKAKTRTDTRNNHQGARLSTGGCSCSRFD